ncbi:hypothetical protein ACWFMI_01430 [Nocardiopsis terrae]
MRSFTSVPAAVLLVALVGCGPETATTTGDQEQNTENDTETTQAPEETTRSPGERDPDGQGPTRTPPPRGGEEEPPYLPDEPVSLGLGESHEFEDGFTVSMGPVERRTESVEEYGTTGEDGEGPGGSSPGTSDEDTGPVEEETSEETPDEPAAPTGEEPEEGDEGAEATEDTTGDPTDGTTGAPGSPTEDEATEETTEAPTEEATEEPSDEATEDPAEEPTQEPSEEATEGAAEEGDDYFAWTVEVTNGTDQTVHTGSITSTCAVGDPLEESSAPVLGDTVNPPQNLEPGRSGSWEADCWADEEDTYLSWTLEFFDEDGNRLYAPLHFSGDVS